MNSNSFSIKIDQIRYIAQSAKCPKCGSKDVKFALPKECHIRTKDGKLDKLVLDFKNPSYWLKQTKTYCAKCGIHFHIRKHDENFYQGLEESFNHKNEDIDVWYYEFDSYKKD